MTSDKKMIKMEYDLKKVKNLRDNLNFFLKIKDNLTFLTLEDNLNFLKT